MDGLGVKFLHTIGKAIRASQGHSDNTGNGRSRCRDEAGRSIYGAGQSRQARKPGDPARNATLGLTVSVLLAMGLVFLWGCGKTAQDDAYLIRVGSSTVTVSEFKRAVDAAAEEVFPGEQEISRDARNELRMRVLNQMSEELIISERGKELGLIVTDAELEHAVADIKADYPDDMFEKTLLENAVSFQAWKKKLATRILVNKVIESELVDKVEITSQDVADYIQGHYPEGVPEDENPDEVNQKIVRHLRHQKAEKMYQDWIEKLRKAHPVDIDQKRWNHLADS